LASAIRKTVFANADFIPSRSLSLSLQLRATLSRRTPQDFANVLIAAAALFLLYPTELRPSFPHRFALKNKSACTVARLSLDCFLPPPPPPPPPPLGVFPSQLPLRYRRFFTCTLPA
jgi:hypothetical protein